MTPVRSKHRVLAVWLLLAGLHSRDHDGDDLTPIGFFPAGASTNPSGAGSDGANFRVTLSGSGTLARF